MRAVTDAVEKRQIGRDASDADAFPAILDIAALRALYDRGTTPLQLIDAIIARCDAYDDKAVWISRIPNDELRAAARALDRADRATMPLWGIPFAVKDNIDCAGSPTTAACPSFAYHPEQDAPVVARLKAAGAILVGKANLDQFATGLNGTRSPYGAPHSVFGTAYISGGSSSGSAVAVAAGLVSFALGTDTAGSGRVPAAFNNIVGIKPTRGLLSTRGVVPACRSLDCVSLFAGTVGEADALRRLAQEFDAADPFSRRDAPRPLPRGDWRIGVLAGSDREFFGDDEAASLYDRAVARLERLGGIAKPIDYAPFRDAAALLYDGPWVGERFAAIADFLAGDPADMDPTVRDIIESAQQFDAADAFRGLYALAALRRSVDLQWQDIDLLLLPTAPTIYTIDEMRAEPMRLNARLGHYTNFVNLLDCCAVAIPAGFRSDGLPFGVTLVAPAFHDDALASLADRLHRAESYGIGKERDQALPEASRLGDSGLTDGLVTLFVVGAHLSGMPLNRELIEHGAVLLSTCRTRPDYRLFVLPDTTPPKPGLLRVPGFSGPGIEGEVWGLRPDAFARFVASIPAPLGIGKVALDDGSEVCGFLAESYALATARDITSFAGWRAFGAEGA
jgi:allophanate hydrolase